MSLYLDPVKMQYTKDDNPETYYQLSGDYEKTEFVLPDNQASLPSAAKDILALALRQSQYACDIQDLQNNNFDYDVLKELFDFSSDGIIVDGTFISSGDAKDIQEQNNNFQAIDMAIKADGNVDVNKYASLEDNVFHVLFQTPNFFDLQDHEVTEIIEVASALINNDEVTFVVHAVDEAKNEVLGQPESKNYEVTLGRTYDAYKEITHNVLAYSESDAAQKALDKEAEEYKFDDIELSLDLSKDDEVVYVSELKNSPSKKSI
jgi:hypothetical protein